MIKKIWTDPVWSKVISAALIGAGIYLYTEYKKLSDEEIKNFINMSRKPALIIAIVGLVVFAVIKIYRKIEEDNYEREEAIRKLSEEFPQRRRKSTYWSDNEIDIWRDKRYKRR